MLINKIENKTAKVGVIGLGYVGLPLAVGFAKAGFSVTGIEIDKNRVDRINSGKTYISDVDSFELASLVKKGVLSATYDYKKITELDCISICVPTPLSKLKDPDVSYIQSALENIVKYFHTNFYV